jgi:prepilin-type N-terminal cleavage/methylation domain-containing protein
MIDTNPKIFRSNRGFSIIELSVVFLIVGLLTAIAVPAMITQRRQLRTVALSREIVAQMRAARQLAMTERQAVTFEYNDATKQIRIINHNNNPPVPDPLVPRATDICYLSRTAILVAAGFPDTGCRTVFSTYSLGQGGLVPSEITYGIPTAANLPAAAPVPLPATVLGDTVVMTPLVLPAGPGGRLYITFQNDGSVIDNAGLPLNRGFFFFNSRAAQATSSAISVVGASGRVKVWRYLANGNSYVE